MPVKDFKAQQREVIEELQGSIAKTNDPEAKRDLGRHLSAAQNPVVRSLNSDDFDYGAYN